MQQYHGQSVNCLGSFGTIVGDHRVFNAVDDNLLRDIAQLIPEFIGAFNDGKFDQFSLSSNKKKLFWDFFICLLKINIV